MTDPANTDTLKVGLVQMAPVWLDRVRTLEKVAGYVRNAAAQGCVLVVFGEALVPGYPFWVELTDGARFNSPAQKKMYAHYLDQGVVIERGDLNALCALAAEHALAIYLGIMERAPDRGGHSLYCTLVYIDQRGQIASVHRKTQPTYEERLVWGAGDGHGLRVHDLGPFRVGGLNCYENWVPLLRSALYAQGENVHVAVWPGGMHNTPDITRFIALESRSFVLSVSGLLRPSDIPEDFLLRQEMLDSGRPFFANGGTAAAAPDGTWLLPPLAETEGLFTVELNHAHVREERQNFDVAGHYARPDIVQLRVNRERQRMARFEDGER
ncbi:carbon-nitrogen hydrolase family protein [Deinococcus sp. AJ005]|uniref:carbon-nitrogen hydrolase family protein n=1 Tax=Deinococcus sp. AJ005 TaxID=2652443 RepID=UPI00125CD294|nr:carbon-nitrogen hydrolase family protein [Deinococcus sp. AJ005]QFP76831.1 carbon-nitrogen hydrolase family protein [Deinococcus sp. AJ005]